ncbi:MAG: response regulator [Pirellulales bacterium]|nr:response regulator [Pirellulales bacterium]
MFLDATVFVVDDDQRARESVCALIQTRGLNTESFPSGDAFLEAYQPDRPGCLITDLRMLGMSGLELQRTLLERGIRLPVILITGHPQTSVTVRAMKDGAVTLLEKPFGQNDLWEAVDEAIQRDKKQRAEQVQRAEIRRRINSLTEKERVVMDLVVNGVANKVIAKKLDVSIRTVESRRHDVFEKMKAESLAELVRMAILYNTDPADS